MTVLLVNSSAVEYSHKEATPALSPSQTRSDIVVPTLSPRPRRHPAGVGSGALATRRRVEPGGATAAPLTVSGEESAQQCRSRHLGPIQAARHGHFRRRRHAGELLIDCAISYADFAPVRCELHADRSAELSSRSVRPTTPGCVRNAAADAAVFPNGKVRGPHRGRPTSEFPPHAF